MKQSYKQIPRKWQTLAASVYWLVENYCHANCQQKCKNTLDKIPEMFVNCK